MLTAPQLRHNVSLAPFTTFGIGGPARLFATVVDESQVLAAALGARASHLPLFVLGGGSNVLVRDAGFPGLVLHIAIPGIDPCADQPGCLHVGAGVVWDELVDFAIAQDLAGIECLAGIPGSVGASPVQNVGAYGQEVAETIVSVRALDLASPALADPATAADAFVELPRAACNFRYRESFFNTDAPGRYIVTRVRFQLTPNGRPTLRYADLQRRLGDRSDPPTLAETAATVREIRRSKGMLLVPGDPDCRSAGSFFKNPIVPEATLDTLTVATGIPREAIPHWPVAERPGTIKLPAAWLMEQAGFARGYTLGNAALSSRHVLALINPEQATCTDIERLQDHIVATVLERLAIRLQREPVLVPAPSSPLDTPSTMVDR